jgi:hypothetical protein
VWLNLRLLTENNRRTILVLAETMSGYFAGDITTLGTYAKLGTSMSAVGTHAKFGARIIHLLLLNK